LDETGPGYVTPGCLPAASDDADADADEAEVIRQLGAALALTATPAPVGPW
jgi:hypothetical protein